MSEPQEVTDREPTALSPTDAYYATLGKAYELARQGTSRLYDVQIHVQSTMNTVGAMVIPDVKSLSATRATLDEAVKLFTEARYYANQAYAIKDSLPK